ncbi:hypothetical protein BSL78_11808 [Apostichopus japonicus]|uniref:Uncharacterized protein n=1 Tax=Stichopus japonicus TaxID=307972 RepID=A0A2G8KTF7_STIJA|nr:hypothetical protein BSL78_11808 [Apostichopus japonicus]
MFCRDGVHLSEGGARAMADAVGHSITKELLYDNARGIPDFQEDQPPRAPESKKKNRGHGTAVPYQRDTVVIDVAGVYVAVDAGHLQYRKSEEKTNISRPCPLKKKTRPKPVKTEFASAEEEAAFWKSVRQTGGGNITDETPEVRQKLEKTEQTSKSRPAEIQDTERYHILSGSEGKWMDNHRPWTKKERREGCPCDLCPGKYFKAVWELKRHLRHFHIDKGIKVGNVLTVPCKRNCILKNKTCNIPECHYHCYLCEGVLNRRVDFAHHASICQGNANRYNSLPGCKSDTKGGNSSDSGNGDEAGGNSQSVGSYENLSSEVRSGDSEIIRKRNLFKRKKEKTES